MAALNFSALFLGLSVVVILFSPSHSLKCSKQKFTNSKLYTNCTDLPSLSAYLHWNYDSDKSSLSIAFIAPPAKSDGWIAWAINPNGTGMLGAQSLIAFKQSNGSMTVDTYNISSYASVVPSKLSFDVSGASAEYSDGKMMIFATLALPEKTTKVNQVWQVGGSVTNGKPDKHEIQPANLNSKATLDLLKRAAADAPGTASSPAPSPATPSPTRGGPTAPSNKGVSRINSNISFSVILFLAGFVLCFY